MKLTRWFISACLIAGSMIASIRAEDVKPPQGFTAVFNGKDMTGWHGMPHFDPRQLAAMSEGDRKAKIDEALARVARPVELLIGPEAGFLDTEHDLAAAAGVPIATLGARLLHERAGDEEQVDPHERDAGFAVVEHGCAHLARIVERAVVALLLL